MFNRESQVALNDVPKVHHTLGCDPSNYAGCSAFGNSQGPPWMHNDRIIPEEGCSCHGAGGSPSNEVILSISGVPRVYEESGTYNLTISLAHSTYIAGGYMIWDYGDGNFTPGDGSKYVEDSGGALSHDNVGNDWEIVWTHQKVMLGTYISHLQET